MPEGIKLSNQLYPATDEKILSQAEYIHDSEWTETNKDQQSINQSLKDKISTSETTSITNLEMGLNAVNPGIGLVSTSDANINLDQNGTIESIDPRTLSICNTVYAYQHNDQNNTYPGVIKGYVRGDINGDGYANVADVTQLITIILNGSALQDITVDMETLEGSFNGIKVDDNNIIPTDQGNITKLRIIINEMPYKESQDILLGKGPIASIENTPLENYISINSYTATNPEDRDPIQSFGITILGYVINDNFVRIQSNNPIKYKL